MKAHVENFLSPVHGKIQLVSFDNDTAFLVYGDEIVEGEDLDVDDIVYQSSINQNVDLVKGNYFYDMIYGTDTHLIIGSGLGTQARICESLGIKHKSIEICPVITDLFKRYNPTFDIESKDGYEYIKNTKEHYGNIIIDAFNKKTDRVVDIFTSVLFLEAVKGKCDVLSYNLFESSIQEIRELKRSVYRFLEVDKVLVKHQEITDTKTINFILKV